MCALVIVLATAVKSGHEDFHARFENHVSHHTKTAFHMKPEPRTSVGYTHLCRNIGRQEHFQAQEA